MKAPHVWAVEPVQVCGVMPAQVWLVPVHDGTGPPEQVCGVFEAPLQVWVIGVPPCGHRAFVVSHQMTLSFS